VIERVGRLSHVRVSFFLRKCATVQQPKQIETRSAHVLLAYNLEYKIIVFFGSASRPEIGARRPEIHRMKHMYAE